MPQQALNIDTAGTERYTMTTYLISMRKKGVVSAGSL